MTGLRVEGGAINGVGRDETIGNWALDPISSSVGFGVGDGSGIGLVCVRCGLGDDVGGHVGLVCCV